MLANLLQNPSNERRAGRNVIRGIHHLVWRRGEVPELVFSVGAADAAWLVPQLTVIVTYFVIRDRAEPAAKRIAGFSFAKARQIGRRRAKYLLENVGDISLRHLPSPAPMIHQGCV